MATVGDRPAMGYIDETNSHVKFAVCLGDSNLPPVALLDAYPTHAELMEEVAFDASRSYDPNGYLETIAWDMDGDGVFEDGLGFEPFKYLAFDQAGVYLVGVQVGDGQGEFSSAEVRVVVGQPGEPPLAVLTADPADAEPNEAVHFDAGDSVDPDGAVEKFEWDRRRRRLRNGYGTGTHD
jgi:hypothetical protein